MNVANFFACRHGHEGGYIVEGEIAKKDVIDAFLENGSEKEIFADPGAIKFVREYPIIGLTRIESVLPEIAPMYHKYKEQLEGLEFAMDSSIHGRDHEARVLLLCLTIAHELNLPSSDRKVLAAAAIYHDTQRVHDDVDSSHGWASKEYYHNSVRSPDPLVEFLCEYHCWPDEIGYKEIMHNRKLSRQRSKVKLLFDIFKDADALDRVRFGLRDIDLKQLRLPISKQLSLVAKLYYENVKIFDPSKVQKPALSEQISSAAARSTGQISAYTDIQISR